MEWLQQLCQLEEDEAALLCALSTVLLGTHPVAILQSGYRDANIRHLAGAGGEASAAAKTAWAREICSFPVADLAVHGETLYDDLGHVLTGLNEALDAIVGEFPDLGPELQAIRFTEDERLEWTSKTRARFAPVSPRIDKMIRHHSVMSETLDDWVDCTSRGWGHVAKRFALAAGLSYFFGSGAGARAAADGPNDEAKKRGAERFGNAVLAFEEEGQPLTQELADIFDKQVHATAEFVSLRVGQRLTALRRLAARNIDLSGVLEQRLEEVAPPEDEGLLLLRSAWVHLREDMPGGPAIAERLLPKFGTALDQDAAPSPEAPGTAARSSQEPDHAEIGADSHAVADTPAGFFAAKNEQLKSSGDKLASIDSVYQFNLSGDGGGSWVMLLTAGCQEVRDGKGTDPTCTISMTATDFMSMIGGSLAPEMAFMTGKMRVKGDMGLALKLQSILT